MYVLIDLRTQGPDVEFWLDSLSPGPDGPRRIQRFPSIGYAALDATPQELNVARDRKFVVYPVGDLRAPHITSVDSPVSAVEFLRAVPQLWNLEQIGRWALQANGEGVKVGHIDTGIASKHPLLQGHPAKFTTFKQNGDTVAIDHQAAPFDDANHGTATASLICGQALGIAPKVELCSAALIGRPWTDAMLTAAIDWMIVEGVRIVWLGVERPNEFCDLHEREMTRLLDAGILPITAVGNKGATTSSTPGNTVGSLSVGAVCQGPQDPIMWDRSGSELNQPYDMLRPDLVGPGHDVYVATLFMGSKRIEYEVGKSSGTSLAGPHLAGLAALCLELRPSLTTAQLADILRNGCEIYQLNRHRANRGVPRGEHIKKSLP